MTIVTELLKDALPTIEQFAPTVAGALGGVPGYVGATVLGKLLGAFGLAGTGSTGATAIEQLASNIVADPQAKAKLQSLEQEHKSWLNFMSIPPVSQVE